jgi:tetratricopeptide (TPR) repeat protein
MAALKQAIVAREHLGPDLDRYAIAALTGVTADEADRSLDVLARACMIQPAAPLRYGMHDLLRGYARELTDAQDGEQEQRAALTRLLDYYLHTAAIAMDIVFPAERHRRPAIPPSSASAPALIGEEAARAWLNAERPSLVAVALYSAVQGWPGHATRFSATLFRYLDTEGYYPEAITIHSHARRAAREIGDRAAEAGALNSLGVVDLRQGRYAQATTHFEQALALYREIGDRPGEARTLASLGFVDLRQGRYQEAAAYLRQSLGLCRETRDWGGAARALGNLGEVEIRQGRYQQAAGHFQQALTLFREIGDRISESDALAGLGVIDLRQGRYQEAARYLEQALALCRETGDLSSQGCALNGLGELLLATGRPAEARTQLAAARDVATQAGEKYEQARAHEGLAGSYQASGSPARARRHWQEALALYAELGAPEADRISARLVASLPRGELSADLA